MDNMVDWGEVKQKKFWPVNLRPRPWRGSQGDRHMGAELLSSYPDDWFISSQTKDN